MRVALFILKDGSAEIFVKFFWLKKKKKTRIQHFCLFQKGIHVF